MYLHTYTLLFNLWIIRKQRFNWLNLLLVKLTEYLRNTQRVTVKWGNHAKYHLILVCLRKCYHKWIWKYICQDGVSILIPRVSIVVNVWNWFTLSFENNTLFNRWSSFYLYFCFFRKHVVFIWLYWKDTTYITLHTFNYSWISTDKMLL